MSQKGVEEILRGLSGNEVKDFGFLRRKLEANKRAIEMAVREDLCDERNRAIIITLSEQTAELYDLMVEKYSGEKNDGYLERSKAHIDKIEEFAQNLEQTPQEYWVRRAYCRKNSRIGESRRTRR
jgi:hypothetical protein